CSRAASAARGRSSSPSRARPWSQTRSTPPTSGSAPSAASAERQSLVTGEYRSSSRFVPSAPKSIFATAFGPAPSSATTVPSPYASCVTLSPTARLGTSPSGRGVADPNVAPPDAEPKGERAEGVDAGSRRAWREEPEERGPRGADPAPAAPARDPDHDPDRAPDHEPEPEPRPQTDPPARSVAIDDSRRRQSHSSSGISSRNRLGGNSFAMPHAERTAARET